MIGSMNSLTAIAAAGLLFFGALTPSGIAEAQRLKPVGIVSSSEFSATALVRDRAALGKPADWEPRGFVNWTGLGVIVGGAAGGIWGGAQIAKSDDPVLAGYGLAIGIGGGALIGGLVGALAYTLSHSPHATK